MGLNKLQVNLRVRGPEQAFMKLGEAVDYEKPLKNKSNCSDEE